MDLKDTILDLKNKIKSKCKINIVKFNDKNIKNIEISKSPRYNFFSTKKFYYYFLNETEVVNEKKYC